MNRTVKGLVIVLLIIGLAIPVTFADEIGDILNPPTIKTVYSGTTPIKDAIDAKIADAVSVKEGKTVLKEELTKEQVETSGVDIIPELGLAAKAAMEKEEYPYQIQTGDPLTAITITRTRYDAETDTMWYWIAATRNGQEVAVNNPIWVYPAPKDIVIGETRDELKNEITVTLKEDPKAAVERVLIRHVARTPIGVTQVTEE